MPFLGGKWQKKKQLQRKANGFSGFARRLFDGPSAGRMLWRGLGLCPAQRQEEGPLRSVNSLPIYS